jgi:hypothetical protein
MELLSQVLQAVITVVSAMSQQNTPSSAALTTPTPGLSASPAVGLGGTTPGLSPSPIPGVTPAAGAASTVRYTSPGAVNPAASTGLAQPFGFGAAPTGVSPFGIQTPGIAGVGGFNGNHRLV